MFHSCWIGCAAHPQLQNTACISKFKQRFTALLICKAKPETQEGTMQSAQQQKCQHHAVLHKNQHSQHRPAGQVHKARLGETSGHERCFATEARRAQPCTSGLRPLEMPELAQSSLLWSSLVMVQHTHTISASELFNSILNLLKAPMVYLNKAAAGFYTLIAKARFLVTRYTLLPLREKMGILGYTCYFINTDPTIIFRVTGLIC